MAENAISTEDVTAIDEENTSSTSTVATTTTTNSKWSSFKLRLSLFRIWFVKNLLVWVEIFLIICAICIFTGRITENTPILGSIIYPIFSPIIDQINEVVESRNINRFNELFYSNFICCSFFRPICFKIEIYYSIRH